MKNGYWNYTEPIQYRVVEVKLLSVPQTPLHWQNVFAGEVRQAVEVTHNGRSFLIDNADGSGLKKIAAGGGPDSMSRHIDASEFVSVATDEKVQQWDPGICKKINAHVDEWQQRHYPVEYQKLQGLKETMAAMKKNKPGWMTGCIIILIALLASCVPAQRAPYGCPKSVGLAFCPDSLPGAKPDTISALIQVSNRRPMRVCYAIPGYVVLRGDTAYLDRFKKPLDPCLTVWRYVPACFKLKRRAK